MTKRVGGDGPAKPRAAAKPKPKAAAKNPGGRPTKFKPEYVAQVRKLCATGATDVEIADFFDVSRATISTWKLQYPDFFAALHDGKDLADAKVVRSLYRNATGYEFTDKQVIKVKIGPSQEEVKIIDVVKTVPGETTAAFIWLRNRQPEEWREKQELGLSGSVEVTGAGISGLLNAAKGIADAKRAGGS